MTNQQPKRISSLAEIMELYTAETEVRGDYSAAFAEEIARSQLSPFTPETTEDMPDPRAMQNCVETVMRGMFDLMSETRLQPYAQRLAWGFVNSFHMVAQQIERQEDDAARKVGEMAREFDPSEIYQVELEDAQRVAMSLCEARKAHECMRDHAAEVFRVETGQPWSSARGSRVSSSLTASQIDARDFLKARAQERREQFAPSGPVVVVSGGAVWEDHKCIYAALDAAKALTPSMVLATTAQRSGVDAIAAAWAASNDVKLVGFKLNMAHGKAAGFKRNNNLVKLEPVQAIICKGSHIQVDLAEKMRAAGVAVTIVRPSVAEEAPTAPKVQAA
jgi:YspA, cpYpsA-related SLOG family